MSCDVTVETVSFLFLSIKFVDSSLANHLCSLSSNSLTLSDRGLLMRLGLAAIPRTFSSSSTLACNISLSFLYCINFPSTLKKEKEINRKGLNVWLPVFLLSLLRNFVSCDEKVLVSVGYKAY